MDVSRASSESVRVSWIGPCFSPLTPKGISHRAIFMLSSSCSQVRWRLLSKWVVYQLFPSPPPERFNHSSLFWDGISQKLSAWGNCSHGEFCPWHWSGAEDGWVLLETPPLLSMGRKLKAGITIRPSQSGERRAAGWRAVKEGREGAGWMENRSRGRPVRGAEWLKETREANLSP